MTTRIALTAHALIGAMTLGCASGSATPSVQNDRIVLSSDAGNVHSNDDIPIAATAVRAKPDAVLPTLRDAYEELGIKVQVFEPAAGQVGNKYFVKFYKLGDTPLSRYIECGNSITGPAADNYKVTMSVLSVVSPAGPGSSVLTRVMARADDTAGSSGSLTCRSIGTLEAALHRVLVRRLGE